MSIALIGVGYWGKNILRNLVELGVLEKVLDTSPERVNELKKQYPKIDFVQAIDDILSDKDIKGVCVATPAFTHYQVVKLLLLAGKDVFVEKPLSLSVSEAEELVELSKLHNRILMVGHILRYHPAVVKLKELIKQGDLGQIYYIYSNRLNMGKLRTEENILWSFAPHDISVILFLVDEEPLKVEAFGGAYVQNGVYDVTITHLEFNGGVKGHIFVSWLHPFKEQKLVIVGSKNMAVFDDLSEEKLFLFPHKIRWEQSGLPVAEKAERIVVPTEKKEPLKEELMHFLECIETRKTPYTDAQEGVRVLRVLEKAQESLISGGKKYE
ncbi:MAG TPA: Gfo/Idh/MocA family oxidoreductase [Candidatus Hydrothermia bacterium]|nr:Gfo/Idh/MocA family oxidoreductase [Candidatus Hydrothermia bacterium]HPO78230.1 Gfo/Idh/MocA family oxidoreductase [Candidatus Hydrothermia bacterium]